MSKLNNTNTSLRPGHHGWRHRLRASAIATVLTVGSISGVNADDTEIFFGQVDRTQNNQPNVMFVLDTSGSMDLKDGENLSRLERMKNAMTTILNQSANINVGLMRFNGGYGGGSVLYPITPIDQQVCESNNCGDVHVSSSISSTEDDVEENQNGTMSLNGNILSLLPTSLPGSQKSIGLRFTDLRIPQGATITNAFIRFTAESDDGNPGADVITIRAEQAKSSTPYTASTRNASARQHGTPTTWAPNQWVTGEQYETTDLSTQVQELVQREDWCGGNAMSFLLDGAASRDIVSYDNDPGEAPTLHISYDSTSLPVGGACSVKHAVSQVSSGDDDAEQYIGRSPNTGSTDLELFTDFNSSQYIGLRFQNVQIPKNSVIVSANVEFTMRRNSYGNNSANIYGEAADSPGRFRRWRNNLSSRNRTNASVAWNSLPQRSDNEKLISPDLSNIVTELTQRNGWKSGNSMAFIMIDNNSTGKHATESYNGNQGSAPKLVISYQTILQTDNEEPTYLSARDLMVNEVSNMSAHGGTPIVGAYHEAAQYFLGGDVDYGLRRGYFTNEKHRVSHPLSYAGGSLYRDPDCTDNNIEGRDCRSEKISGNASYISPMESSCQTNHIVLLSDGDATSDNSQARVQNTIGSTCDTSGSYSERCGPELAHWLATTDHSSVLRNDQFIKTYTIGFNIDHPFLKSIAANGEGRYFRADSSEELVSRFQDILSDVYSVDTSFVAPGATVNQFNRLAHRSDIYFAVFKPEETPNWSGNLKKYEIGMNSAQEPTFFDFSSPRQEAVDADSGYFSESAKSGWSSAPDGSSVTLGGAAEQLKNRATGSQRQLYTILADTDTISNDGIDLKTGGVLIHENSTAIQDDHLGLTSSDANVDGATIDRTNLLKWARGIDVKDDNFNDDTTDLRGHMGDPMHSRPVIVNYTKTQTESYTTIFVGTNEGVLHAFDSEYGDELFAYMPESLLPNIRDNFINSAGTPHPYGLDGPMTVWTNDSNNNVVVDPDETAMLYVGMRRGGSNYYAFDIHNRTNPSLKWVIKGGDDGSTGFKELGQSWSKMIPTRIRYKNELRNVLIFGGGYDVNNDVDYTIGAEAKTADTVGRAIFIIDAETGELIYQLGHTTDTGADQKDFNMKYSFASDIDVQDFDADGFVDTLFAADMGGQVWRFDLDLYHESGDLMKGGVIADLGSSGAIDLTNSRRFFYKPDVALIRENGQRFLSISIGSGWRSHPLNTDVQDRIYSLRSYDIFTLPEGYGKETSAGIYTPVTENDLTDVTDNTNPTVGQYGWMMRLKKPGEKIAGQIQTVNGSLVFTNFLPEAGLSSCATSLGAGTACAMQVSNGRPSLDLNNDGMLDANDRCQALNHSGIPPEISVLILDGTVVEDATDENSSATTTGTGSGSSGSQNDVTQDSTPELVTNAGLESVFRGLAEGSLTNRHFWIDAGMTLEGAPGASIDPPSRANTSVDSSAANSQTAETQSD